MSDKAVGVELISDVCCVPRSCPAGDPNSISELLVAGGRDRDIERDGVGYKWGEGRRGITSRALGSQVQIGLARNTALPTGPGFPPLC